MTDDPVGEARRIAMQIEVAIGSDQPIHEVQMLLAIVERVVGERDAARMLARREHLEDCDTMDSAYMSEVNARTRAEVERDAALRESADLYTAAAETNATVAKMQESLDAAIREKDDARSYAAEIAQGVTHYPHGDGEPCVRCERDEMRQERDKMKAAWYAVSEKASRYEAERDSNAELWATEKAAREKAEAARDAAISTIAQLRAMLQQVRNEEAAARKSLAGARACIGWPYENDKCPGLSPAILCYECIEQAGLETPCPICRGTRICDAHRGGEFIGMGCGKCAPVGEPSVFNIHAPSGCKAEPRQ